MPVPSSFDYAIVRVVPRVERGEFINAGVIVFCLEHKFLEARVVVDEARLKALWPGIDLELVRRHLEAIPRVAAGDPSGGRLRDSLSGSASTGWSRRAAPSFRSRPYIPGSAKKLREAWSTHWHDAFWGFLQRPCVILKSLKQAWIQG